MAASPRAARLRAAAHRITHVRPGWPLAAAAVASGLLVACGSPGSGTSAPAASPSSPQTQPATSQAQPATSQAQPATSQAQPATTSAPAGGTGLAACRSASLRITVDDQQASGAAGSTYYPLDFTNTSSAPCQMYGYPGVSFVTAGAGAGQQIGAAASRNPSFAKVNVRLTPGATAHAWLQVAVAANYPASSCHPVAAHWLRIYPPGETIAGYLGHTFNACSSSSTPVLSVLPVRAGQGQADVTP
jgi:hypothetical protein